MFGINCPTQVHFGEGVSEGIVAHLGGTRSVALVRGASGRAAAGVLRDLQAAGVAVTEVVAAGEPTVASVNAGFASVSDVGAVLACGGGSVMDTGKALAFCLSQGAALPEDFSGVDTSAARQVPCIAVPTTAGTGAEVTANAVLGLSDGSAKVSLRGRAISPAVALVDPVLLRSAPAHVVLHAGLDAVVQTIEAYTSCRATPFTDALTAPNIGLGLRAVRDVVEGREGWRDLAWVSLSSGLALANGGLGAAHGLASVLGAVQGAPHGALCGRLLTPVLRANLAAAEIGSKAHLRVDHCIETIAEVFTPHAGGDALSGLEHWIQANGLPRLADFGDTPLDIDAVAQAGAGASSSQKNAVPLEVDTYAQIVRAAL